MTSMRFSDVAYPYKKKITHKARFLSEMNDVLPWDYLLQPILQKYPKPGRGRRPIAVEVMLRIYFMQQWYNLSDPAMEDRLYDSVHDSHDRLFAWRRTGPLWRQSISGDAQRQQEAEAQGIQWRVHRKAPPSKANWCRPLV